VQVCNLATPEVVDSGLLLLDLKEKALQQFLCLQIQQPLHSPDLYTAILLKSGGKLRLTAATF
jgi:hypothetical protein